jgi:hypothetical protein
MVSMLVFQILGSQKHPCFQCSTRPSGFRPWHHPFLRHSFFSPPRLRHPPLKVADKSAQCKGPAWNCAVSDALGCPWHQPPSAGIPVGSRDPCWCPASQEDKAMPLTDARCRSAQPGIKLQKLTDGGGLQLWLQPTGARSDTPTVRCIADEYVAKLRREKRSRQPWQRSLPR